MKPHHGCPIQATSNVISGKWKVEILWHLSFQTYRFSELRELLPGVSEKVLTAQLRQLERDGLVLRTSTHTVPPRVDYSLSPTGNELIPIMERMCDWAVAHLGVTPTLRPRGTEVATPPLTPTARHLDPERSRRAALAP
jgi:DNA-binding HxlR family transcriptional regulator